MIETIRFGTLVWSHIVLPTDDDLRVLQEHYHFHPLDIEDCRTKINTRPKIDVYDNYYFLILHFPVFDTTETFISTREIKIFWGANYLVTIGKTHWLVKEIFNQEKQKVSSGQQMDIRNSDELLYSILDSVMKEVHKVIDQIDKNVDSCGKALFNRNAERTIEKISVTRKNVILLNTMFKPQIQLFNKLQSGVIKGFAENMEDYWGNIMDYYQKIWDMVEDDGELIKGYSTTFDSLQVNKTNEVMKILTLVSSILLPLTFIASLYGMNIPLPIQSHPYSFILVAGVMVIIAIGMFLYFKKRKWM